MTAPKTKYDGVAQTLHWIMAAGMIFLLCLGLYMSDLPPDGVKWQLYGLHKAVGMTMLILIVARIFWRSTHSAPELLSTQAKWEHMLAKFIHVVLYACMLIIPLSGYVMSSAGGHAISWFGLVNIPLIIDQNKQLGGLANEIHEYAAWVVIGAIALHFLGAMKHAVIDRDATLARMVPGMKTTPTAE